jgi:hypothetical protein
MTTTVMMNAVFYLLGAALITIGGVCPLLEKDLLMFLNQMAGTTAPCGTAVSARVAFDLVAFSVIASCHALH